MRNFFSNIVAYGAYAFGIALAASWCIWIWGFDWGRLWSRGIGLWGMTFAFGGLTAFLIGLFVMMSLHSWLFREQSK